MDQGAFAGILSCSSVFLIPGIVGFIILRHQPQDELTRMAGWLTLKPILTTPLCLVILGLLYQTPVLGAFASVLPGALLSLMASMTYAPAFDYPETSRAAKRLLILDCARWLNTLVGFLLLGGLGRPSWTSGPPSASLASVLLLVAFALPTIFAVVAYTSLPRPQKTVTVK
jgi:hypothetical protein